MILNEARQAARRLRRAPGFSLAVVTLLGLALAATLALGAAASALWFKPLPFPAGERLVEVHGYSTNMGASLGFAPALVEPLAQLPGVERVGVYDFRRPMRAEAGAQMTVVAIGPQLLRDLGARPLLGRLLAPEDAGSDAVLLSESAWRGRFGADPDLPGRTIEVGGSRLHIVGVVEGSFVFPRADVALWTPLVLTPEQAAGDTGYHFGGVQVVARLAPGASAEALEALVGERFNELPGVKPMREFLGLRLEVRSLREIWAAEREGVFGLLAAAVVLVLVVLVANLTGLWLERGLRQRREQAIRAALGASGARVGAGVVAEIAVLCGLALLFAFLLVEPGLALLRTLDLLPPGTPWSAGLDVGVVLAGIALASLLAGLLALVPARLAWRADRTSLANGNTASLGVSRGGERLRSLLVGVQVALAVALLAGGALLGRSMIELLDEDLGFDGEGLMQVQVENLGSPGTAPVAANVEQLIERLRQHPGVRYASHSNAAPFSGSESVSSLPVPDAAADAEVPARDRLVGVEYFEALGQRVVAGRVFTDGDLSSGEPRVVIDRLLAARLFGEKQAVGQNIKLPAGPPASEPLPARVVGVVEPTRHLSADETIEYGSLYRLASAPSSDGEPVSLLLRLGDGAAPDLATISELARENALGVYANWTVMERVRASVSDRIPLLVLVLAFSGFGLALALLGLFALVAFAVERRRREFGLRLAIGASPSALGRLALRQAMRAVLPGLALGLLGAIAVGRLLGAQLHGVSPHDPLLLAAVLGAVLAGVLAAAALPAWRASRVDPQASLRTE